VLVVALVWSGADGDGQATAKSSLWSSVGFSLLRFCLGEEEKREHGKVVGKGERWVVFQG
jgi:hypothetical protein